jgi:hypothetical protein
VLERGRVVEHGSHEELLRRGTAYPRLIGANPIVEPDLIDAPGSIAPSGVNA